MSLRVRVHLLLSTSLAYFNLSFPLKISSSRCLPTLELSWSHKRFQWIQSVRLPQGRRAPLLFKVKCWIWKRIVPLSGGFLIPVVYNWPIFPLSWFPTLSSTFATYFWFSSLLKHIITHNVFKPKPNHVVWRYLKRFYMSFFLFFFHQV